MLNNKGADVYKNLARNRGGVGKQKSQWDIFKHSINRELEGDSGGYLPGVPTVETL